MNYLLICSVCYGFILGIAEFFVLRALLRFAIANRPPCSDEEPLAVPKNTVPTRLRLAAFLLIYFVFALATVYLFTDYLVPAVLGMSAGLAGTVAVRIILWIRRQK